MPIMFEIVEIIMLCCAVGVTYIFLKSAINDKKYRDRNMRVVFGFINVVMSFVWAFDIFMNGTEDFEIIMITMVAMFYVDRLLSDAQLKND